MNESIVCVPDNNNNNNNTASLSINGVGSCSAVVVFPLPDDHQDSLCVCSLSETSQPEESVATAAARRPRRVPHGRLFCIAGGTMTRGDRPADSPVLTSEARRGGKRGDFKPPAVRWGRIHGRRGLDEAITAFSEGVAGNGVHEDVSLLSVSFSVAVVSQAAAGALNCSSDEANDFF